MFTRLSAVIVLAFPVFASALTIQPFSQCDTGELQCCDTVDSTSNPLLASLLGLLGVNVGDITAQVGVTCTPVTVIGVSGNSCSQQPVCCNDNSFNGVIALGCTPVGISI